MQYIITANQFELKHIGIDYDLSGYKAIETATFDTSYIEVAVNYEGRRIKVDIPKKYLMEVPVGFENMKPYGFVVEFSMQRKIAEDEFVNIWEIYWNKKVYCDEAAAKEAIKYIKRDAPYMREHKFRIRPAYIGFVK